MKKLCAFALAAVLLLGAAACGTPSAVPNPPLALGEKYLADLDYEQALLQFDQAIAIEPKNPRGYLGKADALLHLGRQAEAAETLAAAAKQCRPQRAALREARAAIVKSLVDGYIGIASAYEKLGWANFALALLLRVCEELPEEGRLREALEGLVEVFSSPDEPITEIIVPDDVFNERDMEAFGFTWDMDVYEAAAKFGLSRAQVDRAREKSTGHNWITVPETSGKESRFRVHGKEYYSFFGDKNSQNMPLPRGTRLGMKPSEIKGQFYRDDAHGGNFLYQFGDDNSRYSGYENDDCVWYVIDKKKNGTRYTCYLHYFIEGGIIARFGYFMHFNPVEQEAP